MVSVNHQIEAMHVDMSAWLAALNSVFPTVEVARIRFAVEFAAPLYADKVELTGTPLLQHALGTAKILLGMNMDANVICASILHAVPDYLNEWAEILGAKFGDTIQGLVAGIFRLEQIQQFSEMSHTLDSDRKNGDHAQQIESLRKMLLAMAQDIRVVLIKLAERTQTLRYLSGAEPAQQKLIAHETRSLFAPLANRLGVWQIKWELEDLSVRYLEPALYKKVAGLLDERRVDREKYISDVLLRLKQALSDAGIAASVTGRPKHIYSIINKMKRKHLEFNELYDVRAVRILVDDVQSCYAALGLVQSMWPPIASEFDDYIAHPKSNNYRSLHTAVTGPRGQAFEVQIRTHEMHQHSELGVAAHWRYKEGGKSDAGLDDKILWLRQLLEWKEDIVEKSDLPLSNEVFQDQVYVLTPQGKVVALPAGATPVDFAYVLHTDLGHRTRGAKVDGNIVSLNYPLQNGQRVEILSSKQGGPSRDWINPGLGFLKSASARAKVRNWFNKQNIDEAIVQGRIQLDRELHRLGVTSVNQEKLAQRLHYNKLDDLLAAIGRNAVTQRRIALALQQELPTLVIVTAPPAPVRAPAERKSSTGILIEGVGNLVTRTAQCCHPAPPDAITAYITRERGITIHRQDCTYIKLMSTHNPERLLGAAWSE